MGDLPGQDDERLAELMPLVYDQLRRLAARRLREERADHTLQPTALVNEVYLKFAQQQRLAVEGRTHFLALASTAMRQVLVDHARRKRSAKRGGGALMVTLDEASAMAGGPEQDVLALHEALEALAQLDPQAARMVEMSYFGGMTQVEIARAFDRSERWARDQLAHAKAWLRRELAA